MLMIMVDDTENLARSVTRLARRLRQERRSPLTPSQFSVLGALTLQGPMTVRELAESERVSPPSATRMINGLVDAGYVGRHPHDHDGRQVVVAISDEGEEVLAAERARRDQWLAARLAELSEQDRRLLARAADLMFQMADR